jgi:hypothetical protein
MRRPYYHLAVFPWKLLCNSGIEMQPFAIFLDAVFTFIIWLILGLKCNHLRSF